MGDKNEPTVEEVFSKLSEEKKKELYSCVEAIMRFRAMQRWLYADLAALHIGLDEDQSKVVTYLINKAFNDEGVIYEPKPEKEETTGDN